MDTFIYMVDMIGNITMNVGSIKKISRNYLTSTIQNKEIKLYGCKQEAIIEVFTEKYHFFCHFYDSQKN